MPAKFVKGDFINEAQLVEGRRAFACPVDVSGRTDAGIASAVAKRWPAFADWWSQQRVQLGDVAVFEHGADVIFALAMLRGGARSKLSWLDRGVRAMLAEASKRGVKEISVPRLWGGASALDGARAKRIIDDAALTAPITLVVFEQFIRAPERQPEPEPEAAPARADAEPAPSEAALPEAAPKRKKKKKKKATTRKTAAATGAKTKSTAAKKKTSAAAPKKRATAAAETTGTSSTSSPASRSRSSTPKRKATAKKAAATKAAAKKAAATKAAATKAAATKAAAKKPAAKKKTTKKKVASKKA